MPFIGRGGSSPPPDTITRARPPDPGALARRVRPVRAGRAPWAGLWPELRVLDRQTPVQIRQMREDPPSAVILAWHHTQTTDHRRRTATLVLRHVNRDTHEAMIDLLLCARHALEPPLEYGTDH